MVAKTKEALELEKENEQLRLLKIRADLLNISYHPSISFENLLNKLTESVTKASDKDFNKESPGKIARDLIDEANRLIRVRISTVNPSKKEYQGETFLVSNKYIGTVRKFVLFDQPFHAENVLVEDIKNRFYNQFITVPGRNGMPDRRTSKQTKEFVVEVLPPLTQDELDELARQQAANIAA
jgi:hypothetical protein